MTSQLVGLPRLPKSPRLDEPARLGGVDERLPDKRRRQPREMKFEIAVIRVHHDEKALVDVALTARRVELARRAAQDVPERARNRVTPILADRFDACRGYPRDVLE